MESLTHRPATVELKINKMRDRALRRQSDVLAVEEPLEIRVGFGPLNNRVRKTVSITMRTPGNDFELAAGFLYTEGILQSPDDLRTVEFCGPGGNVVRVELEPHADFNLKNLERHFYTNSSCGVCGKTSIEALRVLKGPAFEKTAEFSVTVEFVNNLPKKLRETQGIFDVTGGLHASALFDVHGNLLLTREDVGRHNALDKLVGHYYLENFLPLERHVLLVSGRASFELIQKAAMAGIRFFAAVGAPSSLAVELARERNMTLLGFVRDERFNIYSGEMRVKS